MSALIIIVILAVVAAFVVLFAGRAMGTPASGRKFDETPADVVPMDVSDGTPLDLKFDPLAIDNNGGWNPIRPQTISAEEIAIMEQFGNQLKSERRP
jgi:hypothetical protein